jgi:hypothetical protein
MYQSDKSSEAEHSNKSGLQIKSQVLGKTLSYIDLHVKETIEIKLYLKDINREEVFELSKAGIPASNY